MRVPLGLVEQRLQTRGPPRRCVDQSHTTTLRKASLHACMDKERSCGVHPARAQNNACNGIAAAAQVWIFNIQ